MADQMKFAVTAEQVQAARAKLAGAGFPILGDSGSVVKDGYRIGYSLVGGVLVLEVHAKPRFVPMSFIRGKIRNVLAAIGSIELACPPMPWKTILCRTPFPAVTTCAS